MAILLWQSAKIVQLKIINYAFNSQTVNFENINEKTSFTKQKEKFYILNTYLDYSKEKLKTVSWIKNTWYRQFFN